MNWAVLRLIYHVRDIKFDIHVVHNRIQCALIIMLFLSQTSHQILVSLTRGICLAL